MSMTLTQTLTAAGVNIPASFLALGGTAPYTYAVVPGGAGGVINSSSGAYVAPAVVSQDPTKLYDTIVATDSLGATASAKILVGSALLLFCDIIQTGLGLADGRVYLWDQKIMQPTDNDLYVAVSVPSPKIFANTTRIDASTGFNAVQSANMMAKVDIDIISRGPAARDRKEEVLMALASQYSESQQEINSFMIAKLPPGSTFLNLSEIDGAAIPYRYRISINMQYTITKSQAVPYFDTFSANEIDTNP